MLAERVTPLARGMMQSGMVVIPLAGGMSHLPGGVMHAAGAVMPPARGMMYAAGREPRAGLEITHVARAAAHEEMAVSRVPAGVREISSAVLQVARWVLYGGAGVGPTSTVLIDAGTVMMYMKMSKEEAPAIGRPFLAPGFNLGWARGLRPALRAGVAARRRSHSPAQDQQSAIAPTFGTGGRGCRGTFTSSIDSPS